MFSCQSCLSTCLRAVAPELAASLPRAQHRGPQRALRSPAWHRQYATAVAKVGGSQQHQDGDQPVSQTEISSKPREHKFKLNHLRREVERLTDPVKLSDKTNVLLEKGQEDRALEVVRLAGNAMSCVVSWNHILSHFLDKKDVNKAWKLYNEMKKRGQRPDAYTYNRMLTGLAANAEKKGDLALEKAELIYNSMFAPNSPVKPNIMHTNAMLSVCARARDLDKMFEVAAALPESGRRSADSTTYLTILNAIRFMTEEDSYTKDPAKLKAKREQGIAHAKLIWRDVVRKWSDGELFIKEELVCAMGRVLMMGAPERPTEESSEHADDVFSLVEQTMGLAREVPRRFWRDQSQLEGSQPESSVQSDEKASSQNDFLAQLDSGALDLEHEFEVDQDRHTTTIDENHTFDPIPLRKHQVRQYAYPGHNTLSMILQACVSCHAFTAGNRYWDRLEKDFTPDQVNCNDYLRLLRYSRASKRASGLITKMRLSRNEGGYGIGVQAKTFIIAMSTCTRDNKNRNVLYHAIAIMEDMAKGLETPSLKALQLFDKVIKGRGRDNDFKSILSATDVMESLMNNLRSAYVYGDFSESVQNSKRTKRAQRPDKRLAVALREDLLWASKMVESTLMRSLDYYSEEMGPDRHKAMQQKLRDLRGWRKQMESTSKKDTAQDTGAVEAPTSP